VKLHRWVGGAIFVVLFAPLLALGACGLGMENNSAELPISPPNMYGRLEYVKFKPLNAHACCEQLPAAYTNDGAAIWALDGLSHWWHSNYRAGADNIGYDINTGTTGHVNDTGNFLRKGNAGAVDGYTWTKNESLAARDGSGAPRTVDSAVPANTNNSSKGGAQWITLDLGRVVELKPGEYLRLGYQRRGDGSEIGRLCRTNNASYEIYVSQKDFGWIVDTPDVVRITPDTPPYRATAAGLVWLNYYTPPERPLKFRYVQLRWRFNSSVTGNDYKAASAQNIMFKISGSDLSYDYLYAVYNHGQNVLKNVPVSNRDYTLLKAALNSDIKQYFTPPGAASVDTALKRLEYQDEMDDAAGRLLDLIYRIAPPNEPPEVLL